ncbi:hypothetical protein BJ166DRAFT_497657 [Pestalotiopsis sp. NC0098]|nr:hypothetical protein BJ166DRAFT_497657 [Pestalotiopsis sp. NC0098]
MRPTGLLLLAASPVLCAVQPRTVAQVPVLVGNKNVATSSYPQDSAVNGTIAPIAKSSITEIRDASSSPSTAAAATAEIPAQALDKSIFSLIIFGIAGLCLI